MLDNLKTKRTATMMKRILKSLLVLLAAAAGLSATACAADFSMPAVTLTTAEDGSQQYTLSMQILVFMTALTVLSRSQSSSTSAWFFASHCAWTRLP